MALIGTSINLVDPRDLLEMLRHHPLTAPFGFAAYSKKLGRKSLIEAIHAVCSTRADARLCATECYQDWDTAVNQAIRANRPIVHHCTQGFFGFTIPLPVDRNLPDCLIGGGVVEHNPVLSRIGGVSTQPVPNDLIIDPVRQLERISMSEAEACVEEIFRALPRLLEQQVQVLGLTRTTQRLEAVQKLSRDLAGCEDSEQALAIVSEALVVLFNLPRVLIVLRQPGKAMMVHSTLGLDPETFQLDQKRLEVCFTKFSCQPGVLPEDELADLFPGLETRSAYFFPLGENECRLGAIALLDVDLHSRDLALIELLVNRLAARLEKLETAEGHRQERQFSSRLVSMISALALIDTRKELYEKILEMSAELLTATSGSLMLLNEVDGTLKIAAAKGMNPALAKTMSVTFGEGIAGRVAKNGFPMLVNDIEHDRRVAAKNRPRFKTKSFLSLPLEVDDHMFGVLNLADKSNGTTFSEADLNLVQSFTNHALLMVNRATTLEKAGRFEQLAITDPLTGLYNRRFLEDRLREEFSRCERQQQSFCIILADLDNFKVYNDICGHLAGDNALRKTADLMRRSARDMDIVTRYGGEEFCLILPGTGKKESVFVGERIRRAIEAEGFPGESHLPLGRLTISVGIATFPADGVTANELIHAADLALYQAKTLGRNRLLLYDPSLEHKVLLSQQK